MELRLKGKKALVTGASAGLGAAAAMALAEEGVELFINSRDETRLRAAAQKIAEKTAIMPVVCVGDVSRAGDIERLDSQIGAVDILVSNAGGPVPGQFTDLPGERWQEAADLVLFSAVNLTRMVIDGMIERRWGRLIYLTSIGVLQPINDLILSNTYRSGVTGFCKTISNNYAKYGITANCVCPGYTATERLASLAASRAAEGGVSVESVLKGLAADVPAGRIGKPEELAALITFLASEKAAYITGTSIPVDGGAVRALI
ncbi:MAG: SDR family oxidoreductase [Candidatus Zixiibacteriota bacterium]|nr:MAG: SDR family oxidoreductase [candidate division Zixibacteria bacterium]